MASERALLNAGYSVIHAKDGDEGLRAARENIPDLILLDMMLPKLSGLDVLRALKGDVRVKHIPVIVLSGLGKANESKLLTEGAAAFIVKSEKSFQNNSSVLQERGMVRSGFSSNSRSHLSRVFGVRAERKEYYDLCDD